MLDSKAYLYLNVPICLVELVRLCRIILYIIMVSSCPRRLVASARERKPLCFYRINDISQKCKIIYFMVLSKKNDLSHWYKKVLQDYIHTLVGWFSRRLQDIRCSDGWLEYRIQTPTFVFRALCLVVWWILEIVLYSQGCGTSIDQGIFAVSRQFRLNMRCVSPKKRRRWGVFCFQHASLEMARGWSSEWWVWKVELVSTAVHRLMDS